MMHIAAAIVALCNAPSVPADKKNECHLFYAKCAREEKIGVCMRKHANATKEDPKDTESKDKLLKSMGAE